MPAGRPKKPVALKKLQGTYRADRDGGAERAQCQLASVSGVIIPPETKITCPKTLRTKYVRAYWRRLTANLVAMQVLSYNDLPQLETLMIILEKLREAQEQFLDCAFPEQSDAEEIARYEFILKTVAKLSNLFNTLGSKYYISPSARAKLTLDALSIQKTAQEIERSASGVDRVMQMRAKR